MQVVVVKTRSLNYYTNILDNHRVELHFYLTVYKLPFIWAMEKVYRQLMYYYTVIAFKALVEK